MEETPVIQLTQVIGAWLLASVLLPTAAAHTATYYVATTGNDGNPGTRSQPWRTVAYAVSSMVPGDTTYVMDGTYNEGVIRFKRSGTQAAPIKLLNYPEHSPKIVFIDPDANHRILIQHASGYNRAIGWITIEGLELTNGHDGIKWHSLHDSTIQRNWIHHNKFMGMLGVGGTRLRIDRNRINHNGNFAKCAETPATCNQHHGIYAHGSAYTITNNVIYDNLSFGIQQNGSSTAVYSTTWHPSPEFAGAANWLIAHNTFAYQNYRGGMVVWGSLCTNSRIENNIFYENSVNVPSAPQGIEFVSAGSSTGVKIRNNHFYASGSGGLVAFESPAPSGMESTGNVINVSPPAFVNAPATLPGSPNFALTARSPAIDTGLPLEATRMSFDGTPRPQGRAPDIGAYEYSAGADAKPPAAPVALQAH
jgi:hypothetical protein